MTRESRALSSSFCCMHKYFFPKNKETATLTMNTATEKIETLMITTMETARIEGNNENA